MKFKDYLAIFYKRLTGLNIASPYFTNKTKDYTKVINTIHSCKTIEHYRAVFNLMKLFNQKYQDVEAFRILVMTYNHSRCASRVYGD